MSRAAVWAVPQVPYPSAGVDQLRTGDQYHWALVGADGDDEVQRVPGAGKELDGAALAVPRKQAAGADALFRVGGAGL